MKKTTLILFLAILMACGTAIFPGYAGTKNDSSAFDLFKNYYNLGITATPQLYRKATVSQTYGSSELINKPILSLEGGFEYVFNSHKKWSYATGINFGHGAETNMRFKNVPEKIQTSDISHYNGVLLSIMPVSIEWKKHLKSGLFWNVRAGGRVHYYYENKTGATLGRLDGPEDEFEGIFSYALEYPSMLQGSIFLSTGMYFLIDKSILRINLLASKNLQTMLEGTYGFGSPSEPPHSGGQYTLSGDHLGLSLTWFIKRFRVCKSCE